MVTEGQRLTKLCDEWDVKLEKNKEKINEDIQVLHLLKERMELIEIEEILD